MQPTIQPAHRPRPTVQPGPWRDDGGRPAALAATRRRGGPAALLSAMHIDRKAVFIDALQWDLAAPDGLHEIDAYDGDDTLYLIVHEHGTHRHLGSVRLLPSTGPHLLGDLYPQLCEAGVPRGPDIWEITRLVTRPGLGRDEALQVRRQLVLALFEHALAAGITRYTMMTHLTWLSVLLALGWDCEPLGLPLVPADARDGVAIAAMQVLVNRASLERLRGEWGFAAPALHEFPAGGPTPAGTERPEGQVAF